VFGVIISLATPFLLRGTSGTSTDETQGASTPTEIGPVAPEEGNSATTSLPFTVETEPPNKAPQISIQGPTCLIYNAQDPEPFQVTLNAEDSDGDAVNLDLSYSIGEKIVDVTNEIEVSTNLNTPLTQEVSINLEAGIEERWILLLSHATDPDGASSEAASVITLADIEC